MYCLLRYSQKTVIVDLDTEEVIFTATGTCRIAGISVSVPVTDGRELTTKDGAPRHNAGVYGRYAEVD